MPFPDRKFRKKRVEIFGRSIKPPYLCTPFERTVGVRTGKIFESLETTARKSSIYGKVYVSKYIRIDCEFRERLHSQCQNSFTMESLILAQDER